MIGLGDVSKISYHQPSNMHFDTNIQRDGTKHECDANFTNGLDKESVMHFDKKMR